MDMRKHLIERGMNPDLYKCTTWDQKFFPIAGDIDRSCATFFLYNLTGQIVGYQRYMPHGVKKRNNDPRDGKYYTYQPKATNAVFGIHLLNKYDRRLIITEGIFKAAVLHRLGYNAIAVLTSTPKPLKRWMWLMNHYYDVRAIGDGDAGGMKLVRMVKAGMCTTKEDLDEYTDENVVKFVELMYALPRQIEF